MIQLKNIKANNGNNMNTKLLFYIVSLITIPVNLNGQESDSIINRLMRDLSMSSIKDTSKLFIGRADPFKEAGITGVWNEGILDCYCYKNQPDFNLAKKELKYLLLNTESKDINKIDSISIRLNNLYTAQWNRKKGLPCRMIKAPEFLNYDTLFQYLFDLRILLNLKQRFNNNPDKIFSFFDSLLYNYNTNKIYIVNNRVYERINPIKDSVAKNYIMNQSYSCRDIENFKYPNIGVFEFYKSIDNIIEAHLFEWRRNWTEQICQRDHNSGKDFSNRRIFIDDEDASYTQQLVHYALKNNLTIYNDMFFCRADLYNFNNRYFVLLLGKVDEPRSMSLLADCFENHLDFFQESGNYYSFIAYPYGQHYSRIFFKKKLNEKLPKDKYLLAISAIARVADQEVADLLKKEYNKKKDPRIKREILSAIYQAYYRQKLANRPSNDWFDNQRNLLDAKIEKLEKNKAND